MDEQQQAVSTTMVCYRHPNRETLVTCGRCGRPLCPDCMHHGPVGVRCTECLHPASVAATLEEPKRIKLAIGVGIGLGVVFAVMLLLSAVLNGTPNWLLSGITGAVIGHTIWRVSGKTYNRQTVCWAVGIAIAASLLAGGISFAAYAAAPSEMPHCWVIIVRLLATVVISGTMAWATAMKRQWK